MNLTKMSRLKQAGYLILFSSLTLIAQYVIQGALASGLRPKSFTSLFWWLDLGLWAFRAPLEAWVLFYMFSTNARTKWQGFILGVVEFLLIAITTLTVGPSLRALGYGTTMLESVGEPWFTLWDFGIAAYTGLMIGGAGLAYKAEPTQIIEVVEEEKLLTTEERRKRVYDIIDENREISASELAEMWSTTPQTIYRDVKWLKDHGYISEDGDSVTEKEFGLND